MTDPTVLPLNRALSVPGHYESLWLLTRRLMWANALTPVQVARYFARAEEVRRWVKHPRLAHIDVGAMAPYFGRSPAQQQALSPERFELGLRVSSPAPTKLCPDCAELGYHSVFHEQQWIDVCPIHHRALIQHCQTCHRTINRRSVQRFGESPQALPCGHLWTLANLTKPPPIDPTPLRQLALSAARLRSRGGGERWLVVWLGHNMTLERSTSGQIEAHRLLITLCNNGASDRQVHTDAQRLRVTTAKDTQNAAWLEHLIDQRMHVVAALCEYQAREPACMHRMDNVVHMIRDQSLEGLLFILRRFLWARSLNDGSTSMLSQLPDASLAVIACALLQKYVHSNRQRQHYSYPRHRCVENIAATCGRPLGVVCLTANDCRVYWLLPSGDCR